MLGKVRGILGWSRDSSVLLALFVLCCLLVVYVWWPLAQDYLRYVDWSGPWWRSLDWLLLGIFAFMSLTIVTRADLRRDSLIVLVGLVGGLVIESWGTQTNLWFYYTAERPPLWIIPAWPIASLSMDRLTRLLDSITAKILKAHKGEAAFKAGGVAVYWLTFGIFFVLMLRFVAPTLDKSLTVGALVLCAAIILTPTDRRMMVLVFVAGSALGYFLELWGTTRQCWTYYTFQTPPLFAVFAHGMAAVAFWRAGLVLRQAWNWILHHAGRRILAGPER